MASEPVGVVMTNCELPSTQPPGPVPPTVAIRLCDGLSFIPQRGANEWQCVVESSKQQRFFRIGRREYLIASALDGKRGLNSIVEILALTNPELNIDASNVDQTIRWLIASGIAQPTQSFEDHLKPAAPSTTPKSSAPIDPFMFRVPIFRGPALEEGVRHLTFLCSKFFVGISIALMFLGVACFTINSAYFLQLSAKLFVPSATIWWISAWFVLKAIHELGHAVVCVAHGGKLRGAGIASFYLAPVPYVDTTDMWRLPERRVRAFCAAGGMWLELVASSIAILICQTCESPTVQYFCISIVTLGAFSTLAFNANPLVRFDGYYILSDIWNRPNLWTEGQNAMKSLWTEGVKLFGSTAALSSIPMVAYGIACFLNRVVMMIGLAWGAWITYRGIGLGLIAFASYLWFVGPYLRRLVENRKRAAIESMIGQSPTASRSATSCLRRWGFGLIGLTAMTLLAFLVPSPWQPLSPGFVSYGDSTRLRAQSDGIIAEVYVEPDSIVEEGAPIVRLENPSLSLECERLRKSLEMSRERCLVLRAQAKMPELQVEQARTDTTSQQLEQSEQKLAQLVITAPGSGRLVSRTLHNSLGKLVKVGQPLADIAAVKAIEVYCSVAQADVEIYRQHVGEKAEIYLANTPKLFGTLTEVRPRGTDALENPALAAKYGGPVTVHLTSGGSDKQNPLKTESPRFEARIAIDVDTLDRPLTAGQICRIGLTSHAMTVAGMLDRWKDSLIKWIKPDEPKT